MRAVSMSLRHTPKSKPPVDPQVLRRALAHSGILQYPLQIRLAVLIMFIGFLRQSSLAPPSGAKFDATRHLTPADITPSDRGLLLTLKWSKTIQKAADAKVILLPPTEDKSVCPVTAYHAYITATRPPQDGPLLIFPDGKSLTTRYILKQWNALLKAAGLPQGGYSLHGLRKGGASFAYNTHHADLNDVMTQGTWRSLAVRDYIRPQDGQVNSVHKALECL